MGATLKGAEVLAKIEAGTHVLMPVKPTAEMDAAIEQYFFSRVLNRGAEKKDSARRDRVFAQCWQASMAYIWMVEAVQKATVIEGASK